MLMNNSVRKRDYGFDNIKLFLIVLVVLGHILEEMSLTGSLGIIRACIYSFHMPLFVFVSGYFSKSVSSKKERVFTNYLIPFFIFNTAYALIISDGFFVNIFLPVYAFWYFLSLFFWSISIDYIGRFKPLIFVSVLLGLYCGCFDSIGRTLSLSRTICFFPFFILGYLINKEGISKLRSINKAVPVLGVAFSLFITAFANYRGIIPVKMYEMLQSYQKTGVDKLSGVLERLFIYSVAVIMIVCLIALIPDKEYKITKIGTRTACIYIFSSFIIKLGFKYILSVYCTFVFKNTAIEIICAVILTFAVLLITGNKYINKFYNQIIKGIEKLFIRT